MLGVTEGIVGEGISPAAQLDVSILRAAQLDVSEGIVGEGIWVPASDSLQQQQLQQQAAIPANLAGAAPAVVATDNCFCACLSHAAIDLLLQSDLR